MKKILATLTAGHATVHWYTGTFWVLIPLLANELHLSFAQTGLLISARSLTTAISNLPGGAVTDILKRGRVIMGLTLAWLAISYFGVSLAQEFWVVILGLGVVGAGSGFWHPPAMSILSDRFPLRRGFALSIHGAGANAGDSLAPLLVGVLLAVLTWRQVLLVNMIPGILMALLIFAAVSDAGPDGSGAARERKPLREYFKGVNGLVRNAAFVRVALVSGLRSMAQHTFLTFLPLYLVRQFEMSNAMVGFHVSLVTMAGVLSSPVLGIMSDRLGRKPVLLTGLSIITAFIFSLPSLPEGYQFTIAVGLLGLVFYSMQGVIFACAMDVIGKDMGATGVGMVFSANLALSSIAPFVAGAIADAVGLQSTFYFAATATLLSALLIGITPLRRAASAGAVEGA